MTYYGLGGYSTHKAYPVDWSVVSPMTSIGAKPVIIKCNARISPFIGLLTLYFE